MTRAARSVPKRRAGDRDQPVRGVERAPLADRVAFASGRRQRDGSGEAQAAE